MGHLGVNTRVNKAIVRCEYICEQESPPAWTQETYHPPCSEYSFCCPNWVYPPSWPGWGEGYLTWVPSPTRVPPHQGTPSPGYPLTRVPPPPGYPPPGYLPCQGAPPRQGTPPHGCPMAFWEMLQSIMGYGYPPPRCEQTENITFPHPSDAGGNKHIVVIRSIGHNKLGWILPQICKTFPRKRCERSFGDSLQFSCQKKVIIKIRVKLLSIRDKVVLDLSQSFLIRVTYQWKHQWKHQQTVSIFVNFERKITLLISRSILHMRQDFLKLKEVDLPALMDLGQSKRLVLRGPKFLH